MLCHKLRNLDSNHGNSWADLGFVSIAQNRVSQSYHIHVLQVPVGPYKPMQPVPQRIPELGEITQNSS